MSNIIKQDQSNSNIQQAVKFFQHPDRIRLLEALYHKYIVLGRIGGQVTLRDCRSEERHEIASFLNKTLPPQSDITVRLSDFQQALATSNFACDLPDLFAALFPDRPQLTNPQRREQRNQAQSQFFSALATITQQARERAQHWLLEGLHGQEALFRRYKNASHEEQDQLLNTLQMVVHALDQLPQPPTYERLAPFATRISGDPHYFDLNTFSGRLFYSALQDLALLDQLLPVEPEDEELDVQRTGVNTPRLLLYYDAGLLLDTISSTIAVYNLAHATDSTGQPDAMITHAQQRILILPLHQLLKWKTLMAASHDIYLFENPQVFEGVVDALQKSPSSPHPTLLCTSGWPSVAAIRLLDTLLETQPTLRYHYSGDFDLQGLRIAAHLQKRYPHNLILWHFTPDAYLSALHTRSSALTQEELASLRHLPDVFAPLVAVMVEKRLRAYQESLLGVLVGDVLIGLSA